MSEAKNTKEFPPVVTLFELYGAGATTVGERIAERLGLPFHGQAFSSGALAGQAAADEAENRAVLASVLSLLGGAYSTLESREVVGTQGDKYQLIEDNTRTVKQFAQQGGVIMGRNATVILADRPNTLHVLLTGEVEDRVKRAAQRLRISEAESAKRRAHEEGHPPADVEDPVRLGSGPARPLRHADQHQPGFHRRGRGRHRRRHPPDRLTDVEPERERLMTASPVSAPHVKAQPLTMKNYLAYAAGDAANNVTFTMASMFFILYYTNVVGISGAAIGTMFLLIRFIDAFTDVVMGRIIDMKKPGKLGKFRPIILWFSVPLLVVGWLQYAAKWLFPNQSMEF